MPPQSSCSVNAGWHKHSMATISISTPITCMPCKLPPPDPLPVLEMTTPEDKRSSENVQLCTWDHSIEFGKVVWQRVLHTQCQVTSFSLRIYGHSTCRSQGLLSLDWHMLGQGCPIGLTDIMQNACRLQTKTCQVNWHPWMSLSTFSKPWYAWNHTLQPFCSCLLGN